MATKTWKLGEVCRGGVITTEANAKKEKNFKGFIWKYEK